jgi:CRP-like cAMP-binding protein
MSVKSQPSPPRSSCPTEWLAQLKTFDLFSSSNDEFIAAFAHFAKFRTAPMQSLILQEGQVNDRLLILASGRVVVLVNNEQVAVLSHPGDLMGEISVLTGRPATASLFAETEVNFFEILAGDLEPNLSSGEEVFGYRLYSLLASVLSNKIVTTNGKARQFEITNRALTDAVNSLQDSNRNLDQKVRARTQALEVKSLEVQKSYDALEAQNSEIVASHRKLEELYSTKDMTFKKLNELQSFLVPLLENLLEIGKHGDTSMQTRLERAQSQLKSSIQMLQPLNELYSTEQAIRSRRVLLAEPDRKQQLISKLALGGTGVRLDIASGRDDLHTLLESGTRYDLAFVSSELSDQIPLLRAKLPLAKLVLMASSDAPADIPLLKNHVPLISNIISRHPADRTFTVKNVATTVSKLISSDIFGLEKYLIWGVEVQSRDVISSEDRPRLLEDMQNYFLNLGLRSNISDRAAMVAEELLMNAIYDAPVADDGKSLYNHLHRSQKVDLQKSAQGKFRFACDGMLAAVSVSDPFGGFRMETLLAYLERNYAPGAFEVQESGKGGAGRGLHSIIENSDLVVFNVQKSHRTEVIAFFNLDTKAKIEGSNPSFHFFMD